MNPLDGYLPLIELLRSCVRGVDLADGSTINSFGVQMMALSALEAVLHRLEVEAEAPVVEMELRSVETTTYPPKVVSL